MNAPAPTEHLREIQAELVPVDAIIPSATHLQQLRRKRFSEQGLLELAANIKATNGVLQPILLRPVSLRLNAPVTAKYELVAGERRWLATQRAGMAHIDAVIRDLDDGAVLLAQMSENKQRDDYTPLEESAGYHDLQMLMRWDTDQIAEHIGKSKSYVYARMKLATLCPEARAALQAGEIDFSRALLLARFRSSKLQQRALDYAKNDGYPYRALFTQFRQNFMADLAAAPFALDRTLDGFDFTPKRSDSTVVEVGDRRLCSTCPHNSANDDELAAEIGDAHVCTDRPCFETKARFFWNDRKRRAIDEGRTVISGKEAAEAIPPAWWNGVNSRYLDLDAAVPGEDRLYRDALGSDAPESIFAEEKGGALRELVPVREAAKLLKARGIKISVPAAPKQPASNYTAADPAETARDDAERRRDQERQQLEREFRMRLLKAIYAKWRGPLKRAELEGIAEEFNNLGINAAFDELYPTALDVSKVSDDDLTRYIVCFLVCDEVDFTDGKPVKMLDVASRFKIDYKAIRAGAIKDLKPTSAPSDEAAEPAKPQKPAAKKKAPKK